MNKKIKHRLFFICFTIISAFCISTTYIKLPLYLQQHYNNYVSEQLTPFQDYQKGIFSHKFSRIDNVKSSYIKESLSFSIANLELPPIKNSYYKNIYDNKITNLIINDLDEYNRIHFFSDEQNIKNVIDDNLKNGFFLNQSFYIKQNYSFKNWIYSNEDHRKNIINLSTNQIKRISVMFSPKLKSFTDNEKLNLAIAFTVAHEMAHVQKYQFFTDINFDDKESLADLSAVIYIIKNLNFDVKKSNEIIDAVEFFRKGSITRVNASGYYNPYNYLEILRTLLNNQNKKLFSINNESINSFVINISQYKLFVDKTEFDRMLSKTKFKINNEILRKKISEYKILLTNLDIANEKINKLDRQMILSLAQTYNTSASRADALSVIRLNHEYNNSFNANLALQEFKKDNILFINIIESISSIYKKDYNAHTNLIDSESIIFAIDQLFDGNQDIPLENFIKLSAIINPKEISNLIDNIENIKYTNKSYIYNKF